MTRWIWRALAAVCVWGLVVGFAKMTERTPHLLGLAAAVGGFLTVVWLCTDALVLDPPRDWLLYRSAPPDRTFDPRFSRLSQELAEASDRTAASQAIHESLSEVADRLLLDKYDVSRERDPQAAQQILGDHVTSYLAAKPGTERIVFSPELDEVLDRLESL